MSLHSLSLSLDDSSQDKQRKDSPATSPLSLRHQAGDIKLVQVILKIISAMDRLNLWCGLLTWTFDGAFHLLYFNVKSNKKTIKTTIIWRLIWRLEAELCVMSPNLLLLVVTQSTQSVRWLSRHKRCYQMAPLVSVIRIMPAHHYKSSTDTDLKGLFWAAPRLSAHSTVNTRLV